jgi:hypothetical protein
MACILFSWCWENSKSLLLVVKEKLCPLIWCETGFKCVQYILIHNRGKSSYMQLYSYLNLFRLVFSFRILLIVFLAVFAFLH